jgi:hypothetical protein
METTAEWGKRLRRQQPPNVFFLDDELRESLESAAGRCGATVPALIKKVLMAWLHDQRKV